MIRPEGHPVLAAVLDVAMLPLARLRPGVVEQARGQVLEVGIGTGMNLPLYRGVTSLHAVEPDPYMLRRARERAYGLPFPVEISAAGGEALPFPDASFDTVVATFVLCTIPDPEAAIAEALRVLRPGGKLLFAEHVRSCVRPIFAVQRALEPAWRRLAGGCHLTRDPVALLREAGATDVEVRPRGAAWSLLPVVTGSASRAPPRAGPTDP
ncbi:MAG: class I SAM-dependent methyltransferase [Pseudomonadota bacterium]|nr:class I SAM-dependent methyltransferase [Pseudomonadota bacterium]